MGKTDKGQRESEKMGGEERKGGRKVGEGRGHRRERRKEVERGEGREMLLIDLLELLCVREGRGWENPLPSTPDSLPRRTRSSPPPRESCLP